MTPDRFPAIARALGLLPLLAFAASPAAAAAAGGAEKGAHKADVPLGRVPQVVLEAARAQVEGIELTEAKLRCKKSGVVFKLEGVADGQTYRLKVDAAGSVLSVAADKAGRAGGAATDAAATTEAAADDMAAAASPARRVGVIAHPPVKESSGVVASRAHAGVLWTHNDRGNAPALYAISPAGDLLAEYRVFAPADDWEDVAADDAGNLYVANTGNNKLDRYEVEVYRMAEPDPTATAGTNASPPTLNVDRVWRLRFPDNQPFDCESLFVHDGHGYVISKLFGGDPAGLYRFPLEAEGACDAETVTTLERVCGLPAVRGPVTAADLSRDGARLAVLSADGLYVYAVPGGDVAGAAAAAADADVTPLPPGKLEGVCFTDDGIVLTSEGRDVYLITE